MKKSPSPILFILLCLNIICTQGAQAQNRKCDNIIYNNSIHSVELYKKGFPLSMAIIDINKMEDNLILSFDDFNDNVTDYYYTLVHCTSNWEESNLDKNEYITGFEEDIIDDYKFSYNTIQPFIHYQLSFPHDGHMPTKSGNYIIKVYPAGSPDEPIILSRFMIYEPLVSISAEIKKASSVSKRDKMQEVDFTVNTKTLIITNPMKEIKVTVMQNNRTDNIINDLHPMNIMDNILEYDYEDENLFYGGNEYRHFDMKSFRYQSDRVRKINVFGQHNHIYLYTDKSRAYSPYIFDHDINGNRLIKTTDYDNTDIEADYAWVHFRIPYPAPMLDGKIHIMGRLTNWHLDKDSEMSYNYATKSYEDSLYLKQGYYNYLYVFVEEGKSEGDFSLLENSFSETENSYSIFVYYHQTGGIYDRLVGADTFGE